MERIGTKTGVRERGRRGKGGSIFVPEIQKITFGYTGEKYGT